MIVTYCCTVIRGCKVCDQATWFYNFSSHMKASNILKAGGNYMYHRVSTKSEIFFPHGIRYGCYNKQTNSSIRRSPNSLSNGSKTCGNVSELIIYTNNIVLKVTDIKFSTLQFTTVLKLCFTLFHFLCTMFFGWPPPSWIHRCTELRSSRGVCFEMLEISSRIVCLSAFRFTGRLQCTLLFR
jgi:hypothetical protein